MDLETRNSTMKKGYILRYLSKYGARSSRSVEWNGYARLSSIQSKGNHECEVLKRYAGITSFTLEFPE